jgi:hypothetical protein
MLDLSGLGGSLGGLVGGYFDNRVARQQGQLQQLQGQMALSQAVRNRMMTDFNARLNQRKAEEAANSSGVYDPSEANNVGVQAVNRVKDENAIEQQAAAQQETLAQKQLSMIKKHIRAQRGAYYGNMGLHLLGAAAGAYGMWPQTTGGWGDGTSYDSGYLSQFGGNGGE